MWVNFKNGQIMLINARKNRAYCPKLCWGQIARGFTVHTKIALKTIFLTSFCERFGHIL